MASRKIQGITVEIGGDTSKLSNALKGIDSNLRSTQSQLKDVNKLLKFDPSNTELLRQKQELLAQSISETKDKLEVLKQADEEAKRQLADGDITQEQYDALQREIAETEQHLKSLEQQAKESNSTLQNVADATKKFGDKATELGKKIMPASAAVTGLGALAVKTAADFESSMSRVQALSGATGEELEALSDCAKEMGATTVFSASEAAEGLQYMALAGWDTQQSMDALPGVLDLAAASGMDLAAASDAVTDYLSAFSMEASRAGEMADVMAYAQANSNTSAAQLSEAFANCAANANAMGQDVQQTSGILGKLADQGLKGSKAGTALAAVFRDVTNSMDNGAISINGTKISVQDANGDFRDMSDILADVETATDGLGSAQKAAELGNVFTANSIKAVNMLLEEGTGGLKDFTGELYNCSGTAGDQAATQIDNLSGQISILKSTAESVAIAFGEELLPIIKKVVEWLQGLLEKFNSLSDGQRKVIAIIGMVIAVAGPLLLTIGKISLGISGLATMFTKMSGVASALSSAFSFICSPIGLVVIAIAALVAGFIYLWNTSEGFRNFWIGLWEKIQEVVAIVIDVIKGVIEGFVQDTVEKWNRITAIFEIFDNFLQNIFATDFSQSFGKLGDIMNGFFATVSNIWDGIKRIFSGIIDFVAGVFSGDWGRAWEGVKKIFKGIVDTFVAVMKAPINGIISLINGAITGMNKIKIPDWVPGLGGAGINIPKIPYLQTGGVLTKATLNVAGENGAEAIVPLEKNTQWVNVMAGMLASKLGQISSMGNLAATGMGDNVILEHHTVNVFSVDGKEYKRDIAKETVKFISHTQTSKMRGRGQ